VRWSVVPRSPGGGRTTAALNPAGANTPSTLTILVDEDGGIDDVAADGASLTAEQRLVLQAVYDHFREHASWPTFITIDRPLRREHGLDTAAIFLSLPDSLAVGPRPGGLRPIANDELRLRLPGIQACAGGDVDTERFVRLLRWLAQKEVEYAPEAGDPTKMPRVTAAEVAEHLGLDQADQIGLGRLYALLQLDHWGSVAVGAMTMAGMCGSIRTSGGSATSRRWKTACGLVRRGSQKAEPRLRRRGTQRHRSISMYACP